MADVIEAGALQQRFVNVMQAVTEKRAEAAESALRDVKEAAAAAPEAELHRQIKVSLCMFGNNL